ncbi:MAG: helix-turn-helix domain-containing protein [Candidatus Nanopelagicales bacterium]
MRAKVLKAAMEVAAERGPDRLRVQDIAERAGMSPGHVMYYFGKRDRILVDTLLLAESDLAAQRDRRLASAASPVEALDRLVRLYLPAGADDVRWKLWAQLVARPPRDAETLAAYTAVIDSWPRSRG